MASLLDIESFFWFPDRQWSASCSGIPLGPANHPYFDWNWKADLNLDGNTNNNKLIDLYNLKMVIFYDKKCLIYYFKVKKVDQMTHLALKFIQFYKFCRKLSLIDYIVAQLTYVSKLIKRLLKLEYIDSTNSSESWTSNFTIDILVSKNSKLKMLNYIQTIKIYHHLS